MINSLAENAYKWAKKNDKQIISQLIGDITSVAEPNSFFMAGSPGSGKTEYSKSFIKDLNKVFQKNTKQIIRL